MATANPTYYHHIDQPTSWLLNSPCLIVRGWCVAANGENIRAIRLRTGHLHFPGVARLPRPDVKAAVGIAHDEHTGFEIRATLPSGTRELTIEVQSLDQQWRELVTHPVNVRPRWLPLWLRGGPATELIVFQMPAHSAYPPVKIQPEPFPAANARFIQPKLSLVTPSYQQAQFLGETMSSVLDQTNVATEYVVQDGGSSDGSAEIIQSSSHRLHAWSTARDRGQADAIAQGFAKTSGTPTDVMAWINSDDFYLPGALSFVAGYFARHPDVDVLYGNRIVVNEASEEIGRWFLPPHDDEILRLNDFVPQETMFWRRRIWDRVGGIDPSFQFAMDWDLLLRFQAAGANIVRVPYFLACFRIHTEQKTTLRMGTVGQREIAALRRRTFGRDFAPGELEQNKGLLRYLRASNRIEWLWRTFGYRSR